MKLDKRCTYAVNGACPWISGTHFVPAWEPVSLAHEPPLEEIRAQALVTGRNAEWIYGVIRGVDWIEARLSLMPDPWEPATRPGTRAIVAFQRQMFEEVLGGPRA